MVNTDYEIDYSDWFEEGGYCQVYPIKNHKHLVFKEFRNKKKANEAYSFQKKLSKFDLAPKVFSKICKLNFAKEDDIIFYESSDWGYITEYAKTYKANSSIKMEHIQDLVDQIKDKTGLKFWDCHWYNVGLIKRNNKSKVVCIDTGKESFNGMSNAWGLNDPGPKCNYCCQYECKCSQY
jgi:hypothetical protein